MVMDSYLPHWLDQFLRRHPVVMMVIVIAMAIAAILTLIGSGRAIVAYEGF
jgi:DNA-binding transcriptional LysR family regulator